VVLFYRAGSCPKQYITNIKTITDDDVTSTSTAFITQLLFLLFFFYTANVVKYQST